MKQVLISVMSSRGPYLFAFKIHIANNPDEQQIEPEFYVNPKSPFKESHQGTHYEIEILFPSFLNHEYFGEGKPLHIHQSLAPASFRKLFVCWVGPITNETEMFSMLRMWTVGSVYTLVTGIQFDKTLFEKGISPDSFVEATDFFSENYGIGITNCSPLIEI